jgi:hypothetical protein
LFWCNNRFFHRKPDHRKHNSHLSPGGPSDFPTLFIIILRNGLLVTLADHRIGTVLHSVHASLGSVETSDHIARLRQISFLPVEGTVEWLKQTQRRNECMIRIYGIKERLNPAKAKLSDVINQCMVEALAFPDGKRAHRFIPLNSDDFYYPEGRSDAYTVIEVALMEGRSVEAKKSLIHLLFQRIESEIGIAPVDVEITLFESPACNWGFRGMTGDEANLNYRIDV